MAHTSVSAAPHLLSVYCTLCHGWRTCGKGVCSVTWLSLEQQFLEISWPTYSTASTELNHTQRCEERRKKQHKFNVSLRVYMTVSVPQRNMDFDIVLIRAGLGNGKNSSSGKQDLELTCLRGAPGGGGRPLGILLTSRQHNSRGHSRRLRAHLLCWCQVWEPAGACGAHCGLLGYSQTIW